jgi:anti-sigma factor RsiW
VIEAWRLADLHAYVDDCLEPHERLTFEKKMAEEPALARRAAMWRAQNSAIRSAFDGEGPKAFSISIVRHQNDSLPRGRQAGSVGLKPPQEQSFRSSLPGFADASLFAAKVGASGAFRPAPSWRLALAVLSVCLACVWSSAAPVIPAKGLAAAGVAAFRAFVRPGVAPVEISTGDKAESQVWLTEHLSRPVYLATAPSAVGLVGARIAPYPGAPAAFVVYKSQERLVGVLVQSLDAPATRAPELLRADGRDAVIWTWRGQGFALVGDLDASSLMKIASGFFDPPDEAAQAAPERGSYGF